MTDILRLMVQELVSEGLTALELDSLSQEIAKNSELVNCILSDASGSEDGAKQTV